jgi:hypothetical protein
MYWRTRALWVSRMFWLICCVVSYDERGHLKMGSAVMFRHWWMFIVHLLL